MELENNFILERFNPDVLREYDIRGIVNKDLTANTAYSIGRTFGHIVCSKFSEKKIAIGYDGRLTSPSLYDALCAGLLESGANVFSIGLCPTPMAYFAHYHLKTDAAVMVTGSHNPPEYNGFKMVLNKHSFFADEIQNLQSLTTLKNILTGQGKLNNFDIRKEYVKNNLKNIKFNKRMKIAWDIANGSMGTVIDSFTNQLSRAEHIVINKEVDGTFPNHHPDPTVPKNMEQLIKTVISNSCDIGLGFDGDGDRLGVVDNKGNIIWADQYMLLLVKEISNLYENPKIIMDVKSSKVFFDEVKKFNCEPIMFKTGHSPIKEKMKEVKSPLSGEMSGHICYGDDFFGYDDAMYVGLRLLRILSNEEISLNELMGLYPKTTATPETRVNVEEIRKFEIINEIKNRLKDIKGKIIDIDGIRVENDKGWFLIRASNTQNQLTCRAESLNKDDLPDLIKLIENQLKLSGVEFKFNL
ncbi:MAG: phosphomannomutase/phosphoglucomutase [Pelagibacteraceae bacterium]|jgi:phosphomannomutase|nr:phosphomannomutase/phosphoglucomutase [Pelagibacteraceae bacterium]HJO13200.1 phosphomannomutase/phosphoglucomutase [Alphaproteobacteria bacterium]MBO6466392.1 phosphomannomutase/phosphoglucomutase [Pelagibacteraceae bacterium]MBO6467673.1 phosphomannomutase/phosphoglucomutase [Pelagibacteraceae bacterium]MBO6469644.1 phosphomannomutase/phosphoglucomutase [Pelagibacteraceae bacterium]